MRSVVYQKPIYLKDVATARKISDMSAAAGIGVTVSCGTVILDARSILGLLSLIGQHIYLSAPDHSNPEDFSKLIKKIG